MHIVLELSKTLMYDFFYHNVKVKYGGRARLQMTDTDSFLLEIQTDNWYDDIRDEVQTLYDTSAYPENHPAGLRSALDHIELTYHDVTVFCNT